MIISRTPLRISFSGGGTDIQEHYAAHGGAVLSMGINRYVYNTINPSFDDRLRISYSRTEITYDINQVQHPLVREALKLVGITKGVEITTVADVPGGTGLGSSSSFTVGLLNALYAYQGQMKTAHFLAEQACRIEIEINKEPIGKQDQFIAGYGGLQFIRFNPDESVFVDPVICGPAKKQQLLAHLMVFYLGNDRSASAILAKQKQTIQDKSQAMIELVAIVQEMKEILEQDRDILEFGRLLHAAWTIKKSLCEDISNPQINELYSRGIQNGALGGKVLGAGGGGFILFFVEPDKKNCLKGALPGLREIPFEMEPQGSKIIYVGEKP